MRIGVPSEVKQQDTASRSLRRCPGVGPRTVIRWSFRLVPVVVRPSRTKSSKQPGRTSSPTPHTCGNRPIWWSRSKPLPSEYGFLREDLLLFTCLHLAASFLTARRRCWTAEPPRSLTKPWSCPTAHFRCSPPMSEVAGRLAPQVGAQALLKANGGRGSCSVAHQVCTPATLS